ncbi:MAG: hypothetical protein K6F94_08305 [Bacteroidaceae bacterium]|nr:hypothetical protein [Bacteroidaceae bacterium]
MKHLFYSTLLTLASLSAAAQDAPATLTDWADRLASFGSSIPQEKVYVHMDNSCYFLGDTIWFKAYTRRTDKGIPSNVSGVLYADLLNQDGYLVERQLIKMTNGEGWGAFALKDTLYAGFYELRAYTRWQLNWGQKEHPHTPNAEKWFYSRAMAKEYYRDYEKLYSRVFPVYDRPKEIGKYYHDMTLRPLRRYFKDDSPAPALTLSLFPEGGNLVAGLPCRMAFEAADEEGKSCSGTLVILEDGQQIADAGTVSRGRGVISVTPIQGRKYEALFTDSDGKSIKTSLPEIKEKGVAVRVEQTDGRFSAVITKSPDIAAAMTVMHEGRLEQMQELSATSESILLNTAEWPAGIHQLTVYDSDGRIWADRLFFVSKPALFAPTVTIENAKSQYEPFEKIALDIQRTDSAAAGSGATISVSVRDAVNSDYLYDNGNIMTEMLMASELKGFIPQPDYFFEKDDEEHRAALDLLMMTQGWRRFDWHSMTFPRAFAISQPIEHTTPIIIGDVSEYPHFMREDELIKAQMIETMQFQGLSKEEIMDQLALSFGYCDLSDKLKTMIQNTVGHSVNDGNVNSETAEEDMTQEQDITQLGDYESTWDMSKQDIIRSGQQKTSSMDANEMSQHSTMKRDVRLHAEFQQVGVPGIVGDMDTENFVFRIHQPYFTGYCVMFLTASDSTKWKNGKAPIWISVEEEDYPEFYVRVRWPYPRFALPYNYYQKHLAPMRESQSAKLPTSGFSLDRELKEVTIRASHGGLRAFDPSKPAFSLDAYDAFNSACDAGLSMPYFSGQSQIRHAVARTFIGDMNMHRNYPLESRWEGRNSTFNNSEQTINKYSQLTNLDSIFIYTDYSPRNEEDPRWQQSNQPSVTIDLRLIPQDGQRMTYRDRRYILQGFNEAEDFYHPDYSSMHPSESEKESYRRTLYWNPSLPLDESGHAQITFYNNGRKTSITAEAQGQTPEGTLLYSK